MRPEEGLEHLGCGIIMLNASGEISYVNNLAAEYLGLEKSSVTGSRMADLFPNPDFPANSKRKLKVNGKSLLFSCRPVCADEGSEGTVITVTDVGECEEIKEELQISMSLYRELKTIFDNSYDEIFVTDGSGVVINVNNVCEDYYGVKKEKIIGKHVQELERLNFFNPSLAPRVLKNKRRVTAVQTTRNGQKIIVTCNPVFNEAGEIEKVICNSRNITELLNLQQRLEETEKLVETYREELEQLRSVTYPRNDIVAHSQPMKQIIDSADRVARVDSTVLLEGESGVGKGVIALRIHRSSRRSSGPFIVINCGAIPDNLIESELFGYTAGAFTGAMKDGKKGLIEMAHGGTILLDEISELPLNLQVKILHVIQERKIMPVGASEYKDVDIRIVAASNKDLFKQVSEGLFREDLYYRLNVVPIIIPPLRHRREDITHLINHFIKKVNEHLGSRKTIGPEAMEALLEYHWPGNVRELENLVERMVVTSRASTVELGDLPEHILQTSGQNLQKVLVVDVCLMKDAVEQLEKQLLEKAYSKYKNTYRMAEVLGINQSTVVRKMKKYQGRGEL